MTDADLRQAYRLIPVEAIEDLRRYADGLAPGSKEGAQLLLLRVLMLRLPATREPKTKGKTTL